MIRYSHVSLVVLCDTVAEANAITAHLGVQPSQVRESKAQKWSKEKGNSEITHWRWTIDSSKSHTDADVPERLQALADSIAPFAEKLRTLKLTRKPWVDILYHITPQHPHGVTGEFFWFRMSVELMRRFSDWNLHLSYEVILFDHPEWKNPKRQSWWGTLTRRFRKRDGAK